MFKKAILSLTETAFEIYNNLIGQAFGLFITSPTAWEGGGPWALITSINPVFVAIGSSLVVLFFLMGFCAETMDVKQEMRLEVIVKSIVKLSVAEYFVVNSLTIVKKLFAIVSNLCTAITNVSKRDLKLKLPDGFEEAVEELEFGEEILVTILALIFFVGIIAAAAIMLYQAYIRIMKILIIVPYGAVASSTIAGNHNLSSTNTSFYKYLICTLLESVTMILSIMLSVVIIKNGSVNDLAENAKGLAFFAAMFVKCLMVAFLSVGCIKGASNITQRSLGL